MFHSYKPKSAKNIKAKQVTAENAQEMADLLMGRVIRDTNLRDENSLIPVAGIEFPTLDEGNKQALVTQWVVRHEDNKLEVWDNEDFSKKYERARNTSAVS